MAANSYNTLIAGTIGSGKSTIENLIIKFMLNMSEPSYMVLIDPKRVELQEYKDNSKCLWYANTAEDIYDILLRVNDLMFLRLDRASAKGLKSSDEPHVFIFVDEMTMLMQSKGKKEYAKIFGDICLLGRAARIHLILCAQNCTQKDIPATIRDNMLNIVCLHQRDEGKYRYLLGKMPAAGPLPIFGYAYVSTPWMNRPARVKAEDVWKTITDTSTMDFMNGKTGLEIGA